MYVPPAFAETRLNVLQTAMREHSFATIVSVGADGLIASHLPLLLDPTRGSYGTIVGHLARANPHAETLREDGEVLVVYQGPHAYISPTWYTTPVAVPTWNYVVVHAYGRPKLITDHAALYRIVADTVRDHEARFDYAWDLEARRDLAEKLLDNIVGFEIEISRLEGKWKLNQNRSRADREGVVVGLTEQGEPLGLAVADLMRERLDRSP